MSLRVDGYKVNIRCKGDTNMGLATAELYMKYADDFISMYKYISNLVYSFRLNYLIMYVNYGKTVVEKYKELFSRAISLIRETCDSFVGKGKLKVGVTTVSIDEVIKNLEYKIEDVKYFVLKMDLCMYYIRVNEWFKMIDISNNVVKFMVKFLKYLEFVSKWFLNVNTVIRNSLFSMIDVLYSVIGKVLRMYAEGKISEKGMSETVGMLDEKINEISELINEFGRVYHLAKLNMVGMMMFVRSAKEYMKDIVKKILEKEAEAKVKKRVKEEVMKEVEKLLKEYFGE